LYPGMGLSWQQSGLCLQPIQYDPWQMWYPVQPQFQLPVPTYRQRQQQYVPNPPLMPASVFVANQHKDELLVLVADRRNPQSPEKLRIPPGGRELIRVERDSGGSLVETVEIADAFGNWDRQQYSTPIPPRVLYDMSVYEIFLQSIAIDRTGTSPNPIEDINYQPRSIGFFLIPPGDELPSDAVIDAYGIAEDSQNAGAVRRLSTRELERNSNRSEVAAPDPLEQILKQFERQRGAF
jgi:hypothetical protein